MKALDSIRKRWAAMARFETGTAWESFGPGENCHNMGGSPTVYLSRHVLGVEVDGPAANRRLTIKPHLGDLKKVEGVVSTEMGPVSVSWDRSGGDGSLVFEVDIPASASARVSIPRLAPGQVLSVDGRTIKPTDGSSGRDTTIELGDGKHRGTAR